MIAVALAVWPVLVFAAALVGILCICDRIDDRRHLDPETHDQHRTEWARQR